MSIFRLFELLIFMTYNGVLFVLEYHNRHFIGIYYLKKKVEKNAIFEPKPWVYPFGEMAIFGLLELLVFIA